MEVSRRSMAAQEAIQKHLKELKAEKDRIVEQYYPEISSSRDEFEGLIQAYLEGVQSYLACSEGKDAEHCPLVLINSEVKVEDVQEQDVFTLQIVSPFTEKRETDVEYASLLSPIGRALLLKKLNEEVQVKTPLQTMQYKIRDIKYNFD